MKNREEKMKKLQNREWYLLRSILGNTWAFLFFLIGGRERGKSYAVTDCYVDQFVRYGRPFYWLRLEAESAKKLLTNNAEKLVDPDLRRKYKLELWTHGDAVYNVKRNEKGKIVQKKLMCRVLALSTFYNDKGSGFFDKDFLNDPNMWYNICLDEMNREKSQKKSFDIVYAFVNELENLVRSTKERLRIICIGNLLDEISDLLCCLNFIPEKPGIYKIRKKRAIIHYIENTEAYKKRREGTVADLLTPEASTFANEIKVDASLVYKGRCVKPTYIIKFSKSKDDWFTMWDGKVIHKYNNEKISNVIPMKPYLDELFNTKTRDTVFTAFDSRVFYYKDLITFKRFQGALSLLRPR